MSLARAGFPLGNHCKVIYLSEKENLLVFDFDLIDAVLMRCNLKTNILEYIVNMFFFKGNGFQNVLGWHAELEGNILLELVAFFDAGATTFGIGH